MFLVERVNMELSLLENNRAYRQDKFLNTLIEMLYDKEIIDKLEVLKLKVFMQGLPKITIADENSPYSTSELTHIKTILKDL